MGRWWRAYEEAVDNPKLILLSDRAHRAWFNLMCLASKYGGLLPPIEIIAVKLRLSEAKLGPILVELVSATLLDEFDGTLRPHDWNDWQYQSDVSTTRVKRFRERQRNVSVTPPDTEADTETESKKDIDAAAERSGPPEPRSRIRKRVPSSKVPLPENFEPMGGVPPEKSEELERFKDSARAHDRRYADWDAAWRNWQKSPFNQGKSNGTIRIHPGNPNRSLRSFKEERWAAAFENVERAIARAHEPGGGGETGAEIVSWLPKPRSA